MRSEKNSRQATRHRSDFWRSQITSVEDALTGWGFDLEFGPDLNDRVVFGIYRTVQIRSRNHPESKFYALLHEVGHILIRRRWSSFARKHPAYLDHPEQIVDGHRQRRTSYQVGLLSEEIEAWHRGRAWAEKRGLHVDTDKYDAEMNKAIMTYVDWVSNARRGATAAALNRQIDRARPKKSGKPRLKK